IGIRRIRALERVRRAESDRSAEDPDDEDIPVAVEGDAGAGLVEEVTKAVGPDIVAILIELEDEEILSQRDERPADEIGCPVQISDHHDVPGCVGRDGTGDLSSLEPETFVPEPPALLVELEDEHVRSRGAAVADDPQRDREPSPEVYRVPQVPDDDD